MRAQALLREGAGIVGAVDLPEPQPGAGEVLLRVRACGVCRTDLHVVDGELPSVKPPIIPGHEIVGEVVRLGAGVMSVEIGERVGVSWLGWACGSCGHCLAGRENLCPSARFTGYQIAGGYAEMTVADARFCLPLPDFYGDADCAPLLCAGLIGYRSYRMAGTAQRLGIYGFGAAAHIIAQVAVKQGREVFAFTRAGDTVTQEFARSLGVTWAGGSDESPPSALDAAIIFAAAGWLVPRALACVAAGGTVVCGGIHMSDIPSFPYRMLWQERSVRSVANLTRQDAREFLALAPQIPVATSVTSYPLAQANDALRDLRAGRFRGAAVLVP